MDHNSAFVFEPKDIVEPGLVSQWLDMEQALFPGSARRLLCRVVLKGNAILSDPGGRPLDGDVFGKQSDDADPVTGLQTTDLIHNIL